MKMLIMFCWVIVFPALSNAQLEGPKVAAICMNCHGEKGLSSNQMWPNLAGQKKEYLVKQLNAFQGGHRKDPMMSSVVMSLSKEDIQSVSLYFSNLKDSSKD